MQKTKAIKSWFAILKDAEAEQKITPKRSAALLQAISEVADNECEGTNHLEVNFNRNKSGNERHGFLWLGSTDLHTLEIDMLVYEVVSTSADQMSIHVAFCNS